MSWTTVEDDRRTRPIVRRMSNGVWSSECFVCQVVGFGATASEAGESARRHVRTVWHYLAWAESRQDKPR